MGDEKPLYFGQDVFEDENDNHDIKFEDRLKLTEEEFPSELFIHVFKFLDPLLVASLSCVSKKWYKITKLDVLWKEFCKRELIELTEPNENWIDEYKETNLLFAIPKETNTKQNLFSKSIEYVKTYSGNSLFLKIEDSYDTQLNLNLNDLEIIFTDYNLNNENIEISNKILSESIKYHLIKLYKGDIIGSV